MTYSGSSDFGYNVAYGNVSNVSSVNKFGESSNVDSGVATDIWDRANATDDQDIWTAPTQARTHQIVSTSTNDDGSPAGTGAQTIRVYGLPDWDTAETSEDITMNGTTNVATANQYVIIHRMKVLTFGSAGPNVGTITATADTDSTVTAQILVGEGQTQMAIYGVPSTHSFYLNDYYASIIKNSTAITCSIKLLLNPIPDSQLAGFLTKHTIGLDSNGASHLQQCFYPPAKYAGPCIVKVQGNASANNANVSAGFNAYVSVNP